MKWQLLAFPCLVAATVVGCNGRSRTNETGAVPGTTADSTSATTPGATTTPYTTDSTSNGSADTSSMDSTSSR
jgi:hypothetical protein